MLSKSLLWEEVNRGIRKSKEDQAFLAVVEKDGGCRHLERQKKCVLFYFSMFHVVKVQERHNFISNLKGPKHEIFVSGFFT
jgi:hypothetical protein